MSTDDWGKLTPPVTVHQERWKDVQPLNDSRDWFYEDEGKKFIDPWLNVQPPITIKMPPYSFQKLDVMNGIELFKIDEKNKLSAGFSKSPSLGNHNKMDKRILVFECKTCDDELDVNTTSFIKLVEAAKDAGWQMKWLDVGYNIWCPHCKGNHS